MSDYRKALSLAAAVTEYTPAETTLRTEGKNALVAGLNTLGLCAPMPGASNRFLLAAQETHSLTSAATTGVADNYYGPAATAQVVPFRPTGPQRSFNPQYTPET